MNSIDFTQPKAKNVSSQTKQITANQQIKVHFSNRWIKIPLKSIVRLQGECNYTYVYTENREFIAARTLKNFEKLLSEDTFIRVHKSHIVNMMFVKGVDIQKNAGEIRIEGGRHLEVSRRRLKDVINKLVFFHSS
ncbi:LytTR family DNA-binding domain-containing protein [Emticicia sp. BO119]|uniref:LytR/AlgR family response regulator transcription factor n=1 Tax=Emticicia sp. BO119 TaxID=2757768 RepID=UPI0015F08D68|nr:LytTR family DNA-binding domain-containing protein [Emticicia sp. BO119]MBA4849151.1 LytTR family transcriptional regulator [Emticicia sp. BO119]